jgi:hypothetical protein
MIAVDVGERDRLDSLLDQMRAEFPGVKIIPKPESRLQRAIATLLKIVSFGQIRDYLDGYHTTVGRRIYVTGDWEQLSRNRRYLVLRHELVHVRQFRRYSLPLMAILYLLLPLPFGLAWFRAHFEKQAYAEEIRATAELYGAEHVRDASFRADIIGQFTGPAYGFMWPFRRALERWYDGVLAGL